MNAAPHDPFYRRPWSIGVTQSPGADDVIDPQYFIMGQTGVRLTAESCLIRALCHSPGARSGILPDGLLAKTETRTLPGTRQPGKPPSARQAGSRLHSVFRMLWCLQMILPAALRLSPLRHAVAERRFLF